jgi:hypothetical protein
LIGVVAPRILRESGRGFKEFEEFEEFKEFKEWWSVAHPRREALKRI